MPRIAAIIAVRNGEPTLARVLEHLHDNQIDVYVIDHGSIDGTAKIISDHTPNPVVEVIEVPFDGVHRWRAILGLKVEIADRIPHHWVIHIDADEFMESPRPGETLREMIVRVDRQGYEVLECDEFVFVPIDEGEDHSRGDFLASMRHYYFFNPHNRSVQRAVKKGSSPIQWANTGGHTADREPSVTADEKIRLRHYVGLSYDHLRAQYLGRVFGAEELGRGWHGNRVPTTPDFITVVPRDRLFDLDLEGWVMSRPEQRHLIFHQPKPFQAPTTRKGDDTRPAMPFLVGVGRSGTTMLRLMMDSHPDLAMTPETHWLGKSIESLRKKPEDLGSLRSALKSHDYWPEMGIDDQQLEQILADHHQGAPFETLRRIYHQYAAAHGAARVGDKTPNHGLHMLAIADAFPEARFIHLIRDGRDVALSHRGLWFGPGDDSRQAATFWLWRIREMRQQAQFLPHYLEVHYEDLVLETERVLRRIADFIQIPFDFSQMSAHERSRERLAEMVAKTTGTLVEASRRRSIHSMTERPPDRGRIGRWRTEMSREDVIAFERVAGTMLVDLGYDLASR